MINKKLMALVILLVSLLAVSAVSATDNATSDVASVEKTIDEVVSVENDNRVIELYSENDLLSANSGGTFTDLANDIANATGELKLSKNYVYNPSTDSNYKNGITINKKITINGKGFTINGNNQVRAFNIAQDNVVLRNIKFINCYSSNSGSVSGGAIYWSGNEGSLYYCNFEKCHGSYGGAVYWSGTNGNMSECNFANCNSSCGGAVYWSGTNGNMNDCNFANSYSSKSISKDIGNSKSVSNECSGGAVYWSGTNGNMSECNFENCYSSSSIHYAFSTTSYGSISSYDYCNGGAVCWTGDNGNMSDCNFEDCYGSSYNYCNSYGSSGGSNIDSYSRCYGGAVNWKGSKGNLINCNFENCKAMATSHAYSARIGNSNSFSYGGAIWAQKDGNVINCSFIRCRVFSDSFCSSYGTSSSYGYGGAVYWYGDGGNIFDCEFNNCYTSASTSNLGKVIYWYGDEGNMFNCSFNGTYYDYQKVCNAEKHVYPVMLIYPSSLLNDNRIVIFESTPLVRNITVKLYNVTGNIILYKEFKISSEDLTSSFTVNDLEEGEYQIVLEYAGDSFYSATSTNDLIKIGKNSSYEVSINDIIDVGDNVTLNLTLNEDATGQVKITTSDYTCINELVDGKTSFSIPYEIGETNEYKIKYVGDNKYNPIYINDIFTVLYNSDISLDLNDSYVFDENIPLNYNLTSNCTGTISVFVDDDFKANVSVGEMFELQDIDVGNHNITIIYNGDNYFTTCRDSATVTISKANVNISAPDVSATYKDPNGELVATITNAYGNPMAVNLNVSFNGKTYTVKSDSEGNISIPIGVLTPGTYDATVSYNGNVNYNPTSTTANIIVTKANTVITAPDVVYSDATRELVATITNEYGKALAVNLDVNLNGERFTLKSNSKGQVTIPIKDLPSGSYIATISYKGNVNYNPSSTTSNVIIKTGTVIAAPDITVAYKDTNGKLLATITDAQGNGISTNLNVKLNKQTYTVQSDSNGQISISIGVLTPGNYAATISYGGDNTYAASSTTANVIVTKADTVITAPDVTVTYKNTTGELVATITNAYGSPMSVNLDVNFNGETYTVKSDSKGKISIPIGVLTPGTYGTIVSYKGNGNYNPSSTTANVIINKANPVIVAPDVSMIYKGDKSNLVATITNPNGNPMIVNLDVNFNGETYTVKTNSKGKISIPINITKPGNYSATVSYKGNGNYNPASTTANVVINKANPIIVAQDVTLVYKGDKSNLVATITNPNGNQMVVNLDVSINGETYTVKSDSKGKISIPINITRPGSYVATISYKGNINYNSATTTANIIINKADTAITAPDITVNQGDADGKLVARITNQYGNSLSVNLNININGETYTIKADSNGKISWSTENLALGTYTATVTYAGNGNYNPTNTTATITVNNNKMDTSISLVYNVGSKQLVATLTDEDSNTIEGGAVVFNIDGMDYELNTDSKGEAKFSTKYFEPGSYTINVSYGGNSKYNPTSKSARIIIQ